MDKTNLKIARHRYQQSIYSEAKKYFDIFLTSVNKNIVEIIDNNYGVSLSHLSSSTNPIDTWIYDLYEVTEEYIDVIIKSNQLNISHSNPLFIQYEENMYKENIKKMHIYSGIETVHWGQYTGKKICEIINKDPHYILWCIFHLDHFAIDNVVFILESIRKEPSYYTALEINLIKQLIVDKRDNDYSDNEEYHYRSYEEYQNASLDIPNQEWCPACQEELPCGCSYQNDRL